MIHRAILGSLERFIAIVTEHFGGKWPFWLSPRQVLVVPVAAPYVRPVPSPPFCGRVLSLYCVSKQNYASEVAAKLQELGLYVDVDNGENTLNKKIRNGEIAQYNFILGTSCT